jgi:monoterpene epsilon-lactone hydrolase
VSINWRTSMSAVALLTFVGAASAQTVASSETLVSSEGTVRVPEFSVPLSRYMSDEARRKFIETAKKPRPKQTATKPSITERRRNYDAVYQPIVERARAAWPVRVQSTLIGGVPTQVVTPVTGISDRNARRVLINLHGGGFIVGAGLGGLTESIPVSGLMGIKVVSVDYRMAPEHQFPSASEDVQAVYVELLKQYRPVDIGIYGCSAGGILSAMSIAWLHHQKLPLPGAVGIFSAGAFSNFSASPADPNTWGGDSRYFAPPLVGQMPLPIENTPPAALGGAMDYTANVAKDDPLASPALAPAVLKAFPPTLLITGTRAYDLSAAAETHRRLTKVDVEADLHVWDGMGHCFFYDSDLPESREAYAVIAKFFDAHLGLQAGSRAAPGKE